MEVLKVEAYEAKDQEVLVSPEELEKLQREEELKQQNTEFALEMVTLLTQEFYIMLAIMVCENVLQEAKNEKIAVEFVEMLETNVWESLLMVWFWSLFVKQQMNSYCRLRFVVGKAINNNKKQLTILIAALD